MITAKFKSFEDANEAYETLFNSVNSDMYLGCQNGVWSILFDIQEPCYKKPV